MEVLRIEDVLLNYTIIGDQIFLNDTEEDNPAEDRANPPSKVLLKLRVSYFYISIIIERA